MPLANFGTVYFGTDYTQISATCTATIGSSTGPIGSFAPSDVQQISRDHYLITGIQLQSATKLKHQIYLEMEQASG